MKNRWAAVIFAAVLTLASSFSAWAATGWVPNGAVWNYYNTDGTMAISQWVKNGDALFWIQEDGAMAVNTWHESDDDMYWLDASGAAATGWVQIDSKWYYFHETHIMATDSYIGSHYVGEDGAWVVGK